MKLNEILTNYNKCDKQNIDIKLDALGNALFGKNKWFFTRSYNSETSTFKSGQLQYVAIGDRPLTDGCNSMEYNKAGYVHIVKDMYHEQSHVLMNTKAWNDRENLNSLKSYKRTTNIVRREFVKSYFPSVYTNNYSNDPSEMDAERYGIRQTLNYFNSDPVVTKSEAEKILYQFMMDENYIHSEIMDPHRDNLKTIYDVLNLFEERANISASSNCDKYNITMDIDPLFKDDPEIDLWATDIFLHDKRFKEYKKAFEKCKTGVEQDKILEQVILALNPNAIKKAPPRLYEELLNCRRQMELDTLKPGMHAVPPKRINYLMHDTNSLELTEKDLATIPIDSEDVTL